MTVTVALGGGGVRVVTGVWLETDATTDVNRGVFGAEEAGSEGMEKTAGPMKAPVLFNCFPR
jgi:hypothetical protein